MTLANPSSAVADARAEADRILRTLPVDAIRSLADTVKRLENVRGLVPTTPFAELGGAPERTGAPFGEGGTREGGQRLVLAQRTHVAAGCTQEARFMVQYSMRLLSVSLKSDADIRVASVLAGCDVVLGGDHVSIPQDELLNCSLIDRPAVPVGVFVIVNVFNVEARPADAEVLLFVERCELGSKPTSHPLAPYTRGRWPGDL